MSILHLLILIPFIFAIFVPLFYKYFRSIHTGWFVLPLPVIMFIYLFQSISLISQGIILESTIPWVPSLGINYSVYLDGLSLIFALLITGLGALVVLYSIFYMFRKSEALNNFYVYLLMFMGAMLGLVISDNLIVLYVFWELTSLSSTFLIAYWFHREKSRSGAIKSLLITVLGGFAMLAGFILLYVMTGTFSIREIIAHAEMISLNPLFIPAMILILIGAFTKSAQFPFHIWLPDAMEAPTPISAYLHSATMVKAGIYLIARLSPVFAGNAEWFWIISVVGIVTLLWGAFNAIKHTDIKSILAFSTVSQLGLIICLLGLGSAAIHYDYNELHTIATMAAIFHLINHATFKGCLFMLAGIIDNQTGTRDIRNLGGLASMMPVTFIMTIIAAFSMAGIYPFNGFLSKEMFLTSLLNAMSIESFGMQSLGIIFVIIGFIASILTFLYSMLIVFKSFLGKFQPDKLKKPPREASWGLLASPAILAFLVILLGLFPNLLSYSLIEPAMQSVYPHALASGERFYVNIIPWHGFTTELFMTVSVFLIGTLLYLSLMRWKQIITWLRSKQTDPFNYIYDYLMDTIVNLSIKITRLQMTGLLRDYFAFIMIFLITLMLYTFAKFNALSFDINISSTISPYIWVLMLIAIFTTISIPFIKNRIVAIIAVSVIGFHIALIFVLFRAPDLALTQLLVETITTVILLLCFYHLPELRKEKMKASLKISNILISLGIGSVVTLTALSTLAMKKQNYFESISNYFIENSYELAGGKNMVNVILVDFRGLDTLLEALVLAIAALGVFALIKLRFSGKEDI